MQFAKITKVLSAVNVEVLYFMDLERHGIKCMRAICSCLITKRYLLLESRTIVIPDKDCYYVDPCLMNPCDDFSICRMDEDNEEGFSCPCKEYDGQINRIGDGRKSGQGNVLN